MKNLIKKIGCELVYRTGMFKLASFDTKIIAFHKVNPKYFEKQIRHLVKHYNVIPLSDIFLKNKKAVVITFDDGYKNNLEYAYPILKKYNVPATVFVAYEFIDKNTFTWWDRLNYSKKLVKISKLKTLNPSNIEKTVSKITGLKKNSKKPRQYNFMSWSDLKNISDVFEIGSHTLTHPILTNISLKEAQKEISESKKKIEKKIGRKVVSFAYPNGNYNKDLIKLVKKAGYNYAPIYKSGKNYVSNRFSLYRRGINVNDDLAIFTTKMAGVF